MENQFFSAVAHNQEIINSRVGGLGGSDAKMVYKVGLKGISSLSNTDKKRIAVMLGQAEYTPVPTNEAMERGHRFEEYMEECLVNVEREVKLAKDLAKNFNVFAHADFFNDADNSVVECKCTKDGAIAAQADYAEQLQWYYMLGANEVILAHHPQREPFDCGIVDLIKINRDDKMIDVMRNGIKLLDEFVETYQYEEPAEMTMADLTLTERAIMWNLDNFVLEMRNAEERIKSYKETIKTMMEMYGVKTIKTDKLTISYVGESESRTFDKKALASSHPEIDLTEFEKVTKKQSYITIK